MMSRARDDRKKIEREGAYHQIMLDNKLYSPCSNCGERTGPHFVPPSFGDRGFFMCEKKKQ